MKIIERVMIEYLDDFSSKGVLSARGSIEIRRNPVNESVEEWNIRLANTLSLIIFEKDDDHS